ncbi:MAG: methyltransferase type 11 [endosymbiont of Galathealinum brachiosum]|uniref:Arsenite methyltransferase n=1 Tax=endosymbiont of Galathealinum brachiosum TaxID=2200906 RepID=A0A370DDR1_9GAMM|nr:MAG: methyltransferase type 11 [endosymbiont of Galathealinum brachiosum]
MSAIAEKLDLANNTDVNASDLEMKVKQMYQDVAENPQGDFHFEMGYQMAERLGYPARYLGMIPSAAIESFAGVGYYFGLANIKAGEKVVDLGSGAGMDTFYAATQVGQNGEVVGIDMTDAQLKKSDSLRTESGFKNIKYLKGYIQAAPCEDESFDVVISNGVVNLAPNKNKVFMEVNRLLKPGGRLALSDIVTEVQLPEGITCDATLWAACIGGALQVENYLDAIRSAGLIIETVIDNPEYHFISDNAQGATETYGVKSISVLARKPDSIFSEV